MTRPWRLTRRQRVEMEAALMALRADVGRQIARWRDVERVEGYAWVMGVHDLTWSQTWPWPREVRVLRARVAIALRAALRADEDARCEEALRRVGHGEETGATPGDGWDTGYDEGAEAVVHAMREWQHLDRGWSETVPLALWEVTR